MKVELIYDADCPNVPAARTQLMRAFSDASVDAAWTEWDRASRESPAYARRYGSPTILIEGKDVLPEEMDAVAACCRLYFDRAGIIDRVPPIDRIVAALRQGAAGPASTVPLPEGEGATWRTTLAAVPSVGVALLPKLTCAACWPAYAALLSALGFGFFDYTAYLLPITAVALAVTLATLSWRSADRRGSGPLVLGVVAAALHLVGKFLLDSNVIAYAAVPILIGAAVWNAWPRRIASGSCKSCASSTLNLEGVHHGHKT